MGIKKHAKHCQICTVWLLVVWCDTSMINEEGNGSRLNQGDFSCLMLSRYWQAFWSRWNVGKPSSHQESCSSSFCCSPLQALYLSTPRSSILYVCTLWDFVLVLATEIQLTRNLLSLLVSWTVLLCKFDVLCLPSSLTQRWLMSIAWWHFTSITPWSSFSWCWAVSQIRNPYIQCTVIRWALAVSGQLLVWPVHEDVFQRCSEVPCDMLNVFQKPCPETQASFLSRVTFWWITG